MEDIKHCDQLVVVLPVPMVVTTCKLVVKSVKMSYIKHQIYANRLLKPFNTKFKFFLYNQSLIQEHSRMVIITCHKCSSMEAQYHLFFVCSRAHRLRLFITNLSRWMTRCSHGLSSTFLSLVI